MNATVVREMPAAGNRNEAAATPPAQPKISIVIPLYNEEESIPHLVEALDAAIAHYGQPAEVIIVDDGSKDRSFALLKEVAERDPRYTIIRFRRNFGQTAAFAAGFAHARGEVVITMDADLQNDPMDIPLLMAKIEEGYDIVSGWRKNRQDRWLDRKLPSMLANRLISNVTDVRLHDYGCSLKAYRTEVLKHVRLYGELHRFIPALASQVGATVTEVPVNHRSRQYGRSKYGISRTIRVMLDLINVWFLGTLNGRIMSSHWRLKSSVGRKAFSCSSVSATMSIPTGVTSADGGTGGISWKEDAAVRIVGIRLDRASRAKSRPIGGIGYAFAVKAITSRCGWMISRSSTFEIRMVTGKGRWELGPGPLRPASAICGSVIWLATHSLPACPKFRQCRP